MTTTPSNPAAQADRYLKAAQAALQSLPPDAEWDHPLRREAEFALDAASIYSRLAVAEAVSRSFPGLEAEHTGGAHRAEGVAFA